MRMQKRSAILQPHTLCEDAGGLIVELYIESVDCCYVAIICPSSQYSSNRTVLISTGKHL